MKKPIYLYAILLTTIGIALSTAWAFQGDRTTVIKVYDGDTILVSKANRVTTIRLAGIDAPETQKRKQPGQPYSQMATKKLQALVMHKSITIETYGRGSYGRVLGEIFVDAQNINLEMVRAGLAEAYRGRMPRSVDRKKYIHAEAKAREAKRGIWSLGERYTPPWIWKKKHRHKKKY